MKFQSTTALELGGPASFPTANALHSVRNAWSGFSTCVQRVRQNLYRVQLRCLSIRTQRVHVLAYWLTPIRTDTRRQACLS